MTKLTVYHATPHQFDHLNEGSWVSTLKGQAAVYLLMKNLKNGDDPLNGFMIEIPDFDLDDGRNICFFEDDRKTCADMTIANIVAITPQMVRPMKDVMDDLPAEIKSLFFATETKDLTSLLKD